MFTSQQIEYMQALGLDFDFDHLTDDEYVEIEERVADNLQYCGFDENYNPTEDGIMCESILDSLT